MKVTNLEDVKPVPGEEGCHGMTVRWLITEQDGAKNFLMRVFEIQPGGASPLHSHRWEHEFFVLEGEGKITCQAQTAHLRPGKAVFVPPRKLHSVECTGDKPLVILEVAPVIAEETYR